MMYRYVYASVLPYWAASIQPNASYKVQLNNEWVASNESVII